MKTLDYTQLKHLREEQSITQEEMSVLMNMTQSNYSKLESGQKKIDSLNTIERLASALGMPSPRLRGILMHQENIQSSGMKVSELISVQNILENKSLREDEFVLLSTEVLELEKHDFKDKYSGLNLKDIDSDFFPIDDYPPVMNIICSASVEIGFEYHRRTLKKISIWLAEKKLGVIPEHQITLVDSLITNLMISRVILIENEDGIAGFFDTYMKVVFIATNAVYKSAEFKKGRFTSLKFLTQEEIDQIDNIS